MGQSNCENCPLGRYGQSNMIGSKDKTDCRACIPGKYATGKLLFKKNVNNTESYETTACNDCPRGKYSTVLAAENIGRCTNCVPGSNGNVAHLPTEECEECGPGKYSDAPWLENRTLAQCHDCPAGYHGASGSTSTTTNPIPRSFCFPCVPGFFGNESGMDACTPSPPNTFTNMSAQTAPKSCARGEWSNERSTVCVPCIAGRAAFGDDGHCLSCPRGWYRDASDEDSSQCKGCQAGYYQNETESAMCLPCQPGKYSRTSAMALCLSCPKGFLQSGQGQKYCEEIPSGQVVAGVSAGGVGGMAIVEVPKGNYINNKTDAGFSRCPAGSLGLDDKREICTPCPKGKTSFDGYRCDVCAKGKFGTVVNDPATGFETGLCYPCDENSYQEQNMVPSTTCKLCPTGWSQPNKGSQSCDDDGSAKPEDCGRDLYLDDTSENQADWYCSGCPKGASCDGAVRAVFRQQGDRVLAPLFGYYECPAENMLLFERCTDPAACPGGKGAINVALIEEGYGREAQLKAQSINENGTAMAYSCAEGRIPNATNNLLCATCVSGYMPSDTVNGVCVPCGGQKGAGAVVLFLCVVLASVGFLFLLASLKIRSSGRRKAPHSSLKRTLLTHIQTLSIVLGLNISWPRPLQSFLEVVSSMSNFAGSSWSMLHCAGGNVFAPGGTPQPVHRAPLFYGLMMFCALLPIVLVTFLWVYWMYLAPKSKRLRCGRDMETRPNGYCGGTLTTTDAGDASLSSSNDGGEWEVCTTDDGETYLWNATLEASKWPDDSDDEEGGEGGRAARVNTVGTKRVSYRSSRPVRSTWDAFVATTVLFMYLLLPSVLRTCFAIFECKTICGGSYLNLDYEEKCFDGRHAAFATAVAVPGLIFYGGVVPIFVFRLLWRSKESMEVDAAFMFRWGLIFSGFSSVYWWWEGVIFARKLSSILIVTFMRDLNAMQLHVALGTLVLFLHFQHAARPYDARARADRVPASSGDKPKEEEEEEEEEEERHRSNRLLHLNEVYSLCVLTVTIWSSAFFGMNANPALGALLSVVVIGSNMAFILGNVVIFIIFFGKRNALRKKLNKLGKRLRSASLRGSVPGKLLSPALRGERETGRELKNIYPPDDGSYFSNGDISVVNPAAGAKLEGEHLHETNA